MRFDVLACKLIPVRTFTQPDLLRFFFGVFDFPSVTQHTSDHPERTNTNCSSAMNKDRAIFRIVCDLQELRDLLFVRITKSDRNVEVTQAELFRLCLFFGGAMFAWLAQVDDRLNAVSFQFFEMFETWLSTGAEVFVDAQEVSDLARVLGHESEQQEGCDKASLHMSLGFSRIDDGFKLVLLYH